MSEIEAIDSTATVVGEVDDESGIYLVLGKERFAAKRVSVSWQMMQFAVQQKKSKVFIPTHLPADHPERKAAEEKRNDAGMELMVIMHDIVMKLLRPFERERFIEFMATAELDPGELESAIGDLIGAMGGEGEGKEGGKPSQSSPSEPTTSEPSRVLSFGPGKQAKHAAEQT